MIDVLAAALIVAGTFFLGVSVVGLVRLPDFYSRTHAVAKSETTGLLMVMLGLVVYQRLGSGSVQLLLIAVFAFLANPTAMHALARAALRISIEPWTRGDR